jgi:hypothetical protein
LASGSKSSAANAILRPGRPTIGWKESSIAPPGEKADGASGTAFPPHCAAMDARRFDGRVNTQRRSKIGLSIAIAARHQAARAVSFSLTR